MNSRTHLAYLLSAALAASVATVSAQPHLTDVTVFGVQADGNWANVNIWETRPGNNWNVWIQEGTSGPFLNGPSDAAARPNIALSPGSSSFRFYSAPGADHPYFGINLFFDGSETPSISAYGPMLTLDGPHSFAANGAQYTALPVGSIDGIFTPGAGTLSFTVGGYEVTLTDFYWAQQSVFGLDLTGQTSLGADGALDYVGGATLSVVAVPEPQASLYLICTLAGMAAAYRRRK